MVPDGSAGLYFFTMHFVSNNKKSVYMQIYRNNNRLCGALEDHHNSESENGAGSCSVTVELNKGKKIEMVTKCAI